MITDVVYHAVVLETIDVGEEDPYVDEETIGIYSHRGYAIDGIERYKAARQTDEPEFSVDGPGMEFAIHEVKLNTDLIYSTTTGATMTANKRNSRMGLLTGSAAWWQRAVENAETTLALIQQRDANTHTADIKNAERTLTLRRKALRKAEEEESA